MPAPHHNAPRPPPAETLPPGTLGPGWTRAARRRKRLFDLVLGWLLFLVTLPCGLAIALGIRLSSPGPILFRQNRVGEGGETFRILKFRTLRTDVPAWNQRAKPTLANTFRFGRWLRRSSLDELPQLINILAGEMSLVGPRPELVEIACRYNDREARRLLVPPGLTGLWQIHGDRGRSIHDQIEFDLQYLRERTLGLDLKVLLATPWHMFGGT